MTTIKRLTTLMGKNVNYYLWATLCALISMSLSLSTPIIIGTTVDLIYGTPADELPLAPVSYIVNNFLGGAENILANLWLPLVIVMAAATIRAGVAYTSGLLNARASENVAKKLRDDIYDHLQKLPYDYHVKSKTGDLIQRCTSDIENIRNFLAGQIMEFIRTLIMSTIIFIIMINISPMLTIASLVLIPVIFFSAFIFHYRMKEVFHQQDEMEGELFSTIQENLSGVRVVRAFGRSAYEMEKFEAKNSDFRDLARRFASIRAIFWGSSDFICFLQMFLIIFFGIHAVYNGTITLGTFMIFISFVGNLVWPIRNLARVLADMGRMGVSLDRLDEILHTPAETETPGAITPALTGDIVFKNVDFSYDSSPILNGLSFTIRSGETIAILGATGSGKSTIMHLLLRLYDYQTGSIQIGGQELKNIRKDHLRTKIGMVLQEPYLYSKTIYKNLQMAKNTVKDEEITRATRTAKIHDTIEGFNKGYKTLLGERGVTLSGGQRQRVAIARTIIKDSEILVFDDSLSAVDTDTDAQIRAALKDRNRDTTTIIISSRISTIKEADRIFIMEEGQITDIGTHHELVNRESLYKKIWDIQASLEDEYKESV